MSVRLLFDENLSPRLVVTLVASIGYGHLEFCTSIWLHHRYQGPRFQEFSLDMGHPPKLIAIGTGNCSTDRIEAILRRQAIRIKAFSEDNSESVLILR